MQEIQISPVDLVTRITKTADHKHELILVTGEIGDGKTTWCLDLLRQARSAGMEPVGLVSPAVFEQGTKTAIDLINIANGERHRLAVKPSEVDLPCQISADTLGWRFNPETLAWGNQVLETLRAGELLILDELGPLELLQNLGLTAGFKLINRRSFTLTCVVVRPKLLATALERWPWARVLDRTAKPVQAGRL